MTTEALKTTVLTNLDASPPKRATMGSGGEGRLTFIDGTLTATTGKTTGGTYAMVRVPSTARVKRVVACLDAAVTTFDADIGVYYPTGGPVPSGVANGTVILAALFASAVDLHAIVVPTSYTDESTTYTAAKRLQPLWQAAGLTSDPNCMLDIVLTNTSTTSGAPIIYLAVEYANPGA